MTKHVISIRYCKDWAMLFLLICMSLFIFNSALAIENDSEQTLPAPPEADASYEPDIDPWHKVYLSSGDTYDVTNAKTNTTVYINNPGKYYLKGQSSHCRIEIGGSDVYLYLKDGLRIDPNQYAYVGSSTAAISVWDQGGEVHIISEKNAQIYLGGYYYCPAVRKDRHNTKLIFETEDPSQPGTIEAYRSQISHSAAIGSTYRIIADSESTGNMEFRSGIIKATGGNDSAGIGCGSGTNFCTHLVFSGATVYATGSGAGAGIGGGLAGGAYNLSITGGKIVASGDRGAGIGGGKANSSKDGNCGTITITGGDITAKSNYASGIGCGMEGNIKHIIITGGTIHASSTNPSSLGAGIGGTGANFYGRCGQIDISGGTIVASGGATGGVGIGSALTGESGDTVINISGGYIEAVAGGENGTSIGGGGWGALQDTGHCYVNISGGTILCLPTVGGGGISSKYDMTCTITGGSIFCGPTKIKGTPKDGRGNPVKLMNIRLSGCPSRTPVTDASITAPSEDYKLTDVITLYGEGLGYSNVYPWLPTDTVTTQMMADGVRFYGSAKTNEGEGTLYPATQITLNANVATTEPGVTDGSAVAGIGQTAAADLKAPMRPGYHVMGYTADEGMTIPVMKADGTFFPNALSPKGETYTDSAGKWAVQSGAVTLYTAWEGNTFTVSFDGNRPASASTALSGAMNDQTFNYATAQALNTNAYSLPGYTFKGWNTKPDGTGTVIADGADGSRLCSENGGKVTIYAVWEANRYYVKFDPNGGTGTMERQQLTFDRSQALNLNAFKNGSLIFCGWERQHVFGNRYSDGQVVENLTSVADGEVTLAAVWMEASRIMLDIRLDGVPQPGCTIGLKQGETLFDVPFTYSGGIYTYNGTLVPDGDYRVSINGCDTGKTISVPGMNAVEQFSYVSVAAKGDEHVRTVSAAPDADPVIFETASGWPEDSGFTISAADIDTGYVFEVWQSPGIDPAYLSGTDARSNPAKIAVKGKTELIAQSTPAAFTVRFEGNKPKNASTKLSGKMPVQAFRYAETQMLTSNGFVLPGYIFDSWNTKADGTGVSLADQADGSRLSTEKGAVVALYAQWKPVTYLVVFNKNSGTGIMPAQPMTFDKPETLSLNTFNAPGENMYFASWNLDPAGTSASYEDGENVKNLADTQGACVELYAQWSRWTLFVTNPKDASVFVGERAKFTVRANGSGTIHYRWQVNRGSGWEDIDGKTGSTYTTAPVKQLNNGYRYRCIVNDAHLSVTTNEALLTVKTLPVTGDRNDPLTWLVLTVLAAAGYALVRFRTKTSS